MRLETEGLEAGGPGGDWRLETGGWGVRERQGEDMRSFNKKIPSPNFGGGDGFKT